MNKVESFLEYVLRIDHYVESVTCSCFVKVYVMHIEQSVGTSRGLYKISKCL
jgi:hypothetical protein